jgi:ankyrin repeat protein
VFLWAVAKINSVTSAHYTYAGHCWLAGSTINADPSADDLGDAAKTTAPSALARIARLRGKPAPFAKAVFILLPPRGGARVLVVRCQTPDDKDAWVSTLRGLIVKLHSPLVDFGNTVSVASLADADASTHDSFRRTHAFRSDSARSLRHASGGSGGAGGAGSAMATSSNSMVGMSVSARVSHPSTAVLSDADLVGGGPSPSVARPGSVLSRSKLQTLLGMDVEVDASSQRPSVRLQTDDDDDDDYDDVAARGISSDGTRIHALIVAGDAKALKRELKSNLRVGTYGTLNAEGFTPLAAAVRAPNPKLLTVLLQHGNMTSADLNIRDEQGYTALHWAARNGSSAALAKLLALPEVRAHVRNLDGNTPLHYFAERCASASYLGAGQRLIDRGAHVNATNNNGETALHKAMFNNTSIELRKKLVMWLLANHADPNIRSAKGDSPLHYAVYMAHPQLVLPLLQGGADMDAIAADGSTALEIARREQKPAIVAALQEYRAKYSAGLSRLKQGLKEHGLLHVLNDADLNRQLHAFQESRLCGECVVFWNSCEQYRKLAADHEARKVEAARLFKLHFSAASEYEVNLSSSVRRDLQARVADGAVDLFDAAQEEMMELMLVNLRSDGLDVARLLSPSDSRHHGHERARTNNHHHATSSPLLVPDEMQTRSRSHSLSGSSGAVAKKKKKQGSKPSALSGSPPTTPRRGGAREIDMQLNMQSALYDDDDDLDLMAFRRSRSNTIDTPASPRDLDFPPMSSPPVPQRKLATGNVSMRANTASPAPSGGAASASSSSPPPLTAQPTATTLHEAIINDDAAAVRQLLAAGGARFDELDADGMTPFNSALKRNAKNVLGVLLQPKALPKKVYNLRDQFGYTPLHWAARSVPNDCSGDGALVWLVAVAGIDLNARNDDGNTPLHYFAERCASPTCEQLLALLLQRGADVHARNKIAETPLHKAALNRACGLTLISGLLRAGADVNAASQQLETALHYAVHVGNTVLFAPLLMAGADPNRRTSSARTALDLASSVPEVSAHLRSAIQSAEQAGKQAASSPRTPARTLKSAPTMARMSQEDLPVSPPPPIPPFPESTLNARPPPNLPDGANAASPSPPPLSAPVATPQLTSVPSMNRIGSGPLSIRSVDQATLSRNVLDALVDEERCKALLEHMARNRTPALVLFLQAVLRYTRIASSAARIADAQDIYDQHLAAGAPHAVNLDAALVHAVYQEVENGDNDLFDACFRAALQTLAEQLSIDCFAV